MKEALKMAGDLLKKLEKDLIIETCELAKTLGAIDSALAQPEQEPVAWAESHEDGNINWGVETVISDDPSWLDNPLPLYTHPPAPTAQPEIEYQERILRLEGALKKALAQPAVAKQHKHSAPHGEPVAWVYPEFWEHLKSVHCGTAYAFDGSGPNSDVERQPLYTTPPTQCSQRPSRSDIKPLTDEQKNKIYNDWCDLGTEGSYDDLMVAVEAAHGIKGDA